MSFYLLDANIFIRANREFYPLDRVPEFWDFCLYLAEHRKNIGTTESIWGELIVGRANDPVTLWAKDKTHKSLLCTIPEASPASLQKVLEQYTLEKIKGGKMIPHPPLTQEDLTTAGKDPFLIAAALEKNGGCIITMEDSSRSLPRGRRRIPDVCNALGIKCLHLRDAIRELDFCTDRTRWKKI